MRIIGVRNGRGKVVGKMLSRPRSLRSPVRSPWLVQGLLESGSNFGGPGGGASML